MRIFAAVHKIRRDRGTADLPTALSVINHVGFIVDNVQQRVAQWKAAGVERRFSCWLRDLSSVTPTACASKSWSGRR
jgi:hypothetical protein